MSVILPVLLAAEEVGYEEINQLSERFQEAQPGLMMMLSGLTVAGVLLGLTFAGAYLWMRSQGHDLLTRREPQGEVEWNLLHVLGAAATLVMLQFLASPFLPGNPDTYSPFYKAVLGTSFLTLLAALVFLVVKTELGGWPEVDPERHRLRDAGLGMLVYIGIFPALLGAMMASDWLVRYLDHTPEVNEALVAALLANPWQELALVVMVVVLAAVNEELLFRGFLYPACRKLMGVPAAIVTTSILFMAIHPPLNFLPILILALALAYVYERTQSLVAPMVIHALNNGLMFGFFLTMKHGAGT